MTNTQILNAYWLRDFGTRPEQRSARTLIGGEDATKMLKQVRSRISTLILKRKAAKLVDAINREKIFFNFI